MDDLVFLLFLLRQFPVQRTAESTGKQKWNMFFFLGLLSFLFREIDFESVRRSMNQTQTIRSNRITNFTSDKNRKIETMSASSDLISTLSFKFRSKEWRIARLKFFVRIYSIIYVGQKHLPMNRSLFPVHDWPCKESTRQVRFRFHRFCEKLQIILFSIQRISRSPLSPEWRMGTCFVSTMRLPWCLGPDDNILHSENRGRKKSNYSNFSLL